MIKHSTTLAIVLILLFTLAGPVSAISYNPGVSVGHYVMFGKYWGGRGHRFHQKHKGNRLAKVRNSRNQWNRNYAHFLGKA